MNQIKKQTKHNLMQQIGFSYKNGSPICRFARRFKTKSHALLLKGALIAVASFIVPGSAAVFVLNQGTAQAQTPNTTVNFQARILQSSGALVPDGNYHIEFKLYDDISAGATAQGTCTGNCLWMETRTTGNLVRVVNGYISVNLGSVTAFGSTIPWSQNLYITMRVGGSGGSASWDTEMTNSGNRMKLNTVPLALVSNNVRTSNRNSASTASDDIAIQTGNATGSTSNSGSIAINVGSATGTRGSISIGTGANAPNAIQIGQATTQTAITASSLLLNTATLQRTAAGTTNLNLIDGSNTTLSITNSGSGVANVTVDGTLTVATAPTISSFSTAGVVTNSAAGLLQSNTSLGVSLGGTGTTTAFTTGSIVFAGASGVYSQDNANLFWDNTNKTLGLGTASSATNKLNLGSSTTNAATTRGAVLTVAGASTASGAHTITGTYNDVTNTVSNTFTNSGSVTGTINSILQNGAGTLSVLEGQYNTLNVSAGTVTAAIGNENLLSVTGSGNVGTAHGLLVRNAVETSSGSITNLIGATIENQTTGATSNTNLLLGTSTPTAGNWSIYNASSYNNLFAGSVLASNASTGSTIATSGTGGSNVTSITLGSAGFANGDIIFVDNTGGSGQDYYTRITSGGGTTTLTVDVPVAYGTAAGYTGNANITKYNIQNIGAASTGTTFADSSRFFQGFFLGGVRTGAGSTTLSDQNLTSTQALYLNTGGNNTRLTIGSAGSVGIGVTSAAKILEVRDGTNAQIRISSDATHFVDFQAMTNGDAAVTGFTGGLYFASYGLGNSTRILANGSLNVYDSGGNIALDVNTSSGGVTMNTTTTVASTSANAFKVQATGGNQVLVVDTSAGQVLLGKGSTTAGKLVFQNATNNNTITLQASVTAASYTLSLPVLTANDTLCAVTLANCTGTGSTLQGAYNADVNGSDARIDLTSADGSLIVSNPSSGGSTSTYVLTVEQLATGAVGGLDVQSAGTGNLLRVRDTTATAVDVLTVANGGATTLRSQTNSSTALQVQNAAGDTGLIYSTLSSNATLGMTNSNFETNTTGWAQRTGCTISQSTAQYFVGYASAQCTNTATANAGMNYNVTLSNSTQYTFSFYAKTTGTAGSVLTFGYAYNGSNEVTYVTTNDYIGTAWGRHKLTFTPTGITGTPYFFIKQSDGVARNIFIDAVQIDAAADANAYSGTGTIQLPTISGPMFIQPAQNGVALEISSIANGYNKLLSVDTNSYTVAIATYGGGTNNAQLQVGNQTTADYVNTALIASGGTRTLLAQADSNTINVFELQKSDGSTLFAADVTTSTLRPGSGPTYSTVAQTNTLLESTNSPGLYGSSVAIGKDGLPIVAYYENVAGDLKVMHCGNSLCSSGNVTTVADAGGNGGDTNVSRLEIAVAPDGFAVISYHDSSVGALKVYKCSNTNCTSGTATTVDGGGGRGMFNQIAIGADGLPIISYQADFGDSLKVVKCGVADCSSGNTITTLTAATGLGAGRYNDIAIGVDGLPVIMDDEANANDLIFFKCGNAACSSGNVKRTIYYANVSDDASMAIGRDGYPIMVYRSAATGSLAFFKCGSIDCSLGNIPNDNGFGAAAASSTIRIGSDGLPIVVTYNFSTMMIAHCSDQACSSYTDSYPVGTGTPGLWGGMAIAPDGLPIIVHHEGGSQDLYAFKCGNVTCNGSSFVPTTSVTLGSADKSFGGVFVDTINVNKQDAKISLNGAGDFSTTGFTARANGALEAKSLDLTGANLSWAGAVYDTSFIDYGESIAISGKYGFAVGSASDSISSLDISDPQHPAFINKLTNATLDGADEVVALGGKYAYVTAGLSDCFAVVDISNPYALSMVGSVCDSVKLNQAAGTQINGNYAFVTSSAGSFTVIDISTPQSPRIVATLTDGTNLPSPDNIVIDGRYAYVNNYFNARTTVLDISNPLAPTVVGSVSDGTLLMNPAGIAKVGRYLYVAANGYMDIIDVSNPTTPTIIGYAADSVLGSSGGIAIAGQFAIVTADNADAVVTINIQDVVHPKIVQAEYSWGVYYGSDIKIAGSYLYIPVNNSVTIIKIGGLSTNTATLGSANATNLYVDTDATIGASLSVQGSTNIGANLKVDGSVTSSKDIVIGARADSGGTTSDWAKISQTTAGTIANGGTSSIAGIQSQVVYNGSLYVGTSKTGAAEIYRYDGGTTWTKVSQTTAGTIASGGTSAIDGVISMAVFNGYLYVSTFKTGAAEIYRYDGGTTWTKVSQTTAGTIAASGTTAIDGVYGLQVMGGSLYAGSRKTGAAEVYRYMGGTTWQKVSNATAGTIASGGTAAIDMIGAMTVYNNNLYIGTIKGAASAEVYRYDGGTNWVKVSQATAGTISAGDTASIQLINSMTVYNGRMFVATFKTGAGEIYRYDGGSDWTKVSQATAGTIAASGTSSIDSVNFLQVYNGVLYAGTTKTNAGEVYRYDGTVGSWTKVSQATAGTIAASGTSSIDKAQSSVVFNGNLIVGTSEGTSAEVYTYTAYEGQSYALQFQSSSDNASGTSFLQNAAQISFVAEQQSIGGAGNGVNGTGSFLFSHGINTITGAYDLAEDYPTRDDSLEQGDIVSIDPNEQTFVQKGDSTNEGLLVGVYSTNPALRLSQKDATINGARAVPVALAGRVPVKVSTENGPINPGDPITISSTQPGVGVKAIRSGRIIGMSMGTYNSEGVGEVTVFINPSFYTYQINNVLQGLGAELVSLNVSGEARLENLEVTTQARIATLKVSGNAEFAGDIKITAPVNTRSAVIRSFVASEPIEPGKVVVLDDTQDGHVLQSNQAADPRVIGIAVTQAIHAGDSIEVAVGGSVQADTSRLTIRPGSLLVTSVAGTVDANPSPAAGTILGKATSSPDSNGRLWLIVVIQ